MRRRAGEGTGQGNDAPSSRERAAAGAKADVSAAEGLVLDRFLPYRLSVLATTVSRALASRYAEQFGLTIAQWRVVAVLGSHSGLAARQVAERTCMDKVTVSRAVGGLVADGRVRSRVDTEDRRRTVLRLSASGRRLYERVAPLALSYETELLAELDATERRRLDELLTVLAERVDAVEAAARRGAAVAVSSR